MGMENLSSQKPANAIEASSRKFEDLERFLSGYFDELRGIKPAAMDFKGLPKPPKGKKEETYLKWIKNGARINPDLVTGEAGSEKTKQFYFELNLAYQQAKEFLVSVLGYAENEVSLGPPSLSSKIDVFNLLDKTVLVGEEEGGMAKNYCRIVKATLATLETFREDAKLLAELAEEMDNRITVDLRKRRTNISASEDVPPIALYDSQKGLFTSSANSEIKGTYASRPKDVQKAVLRYINRPEANAKKALEDGVGLRITMTPDQVVEFMPQILEWFLINMGSRGFDIKNKSGFLNGAQFDALMESLKKSGISSDILNIEQKAESNDTGGNFQSLTIKGSWEPELKKEEGQTVSAHARQFELQFVLPDNKNEDGANDHNIYDAVKCISARTRLDGKCSRQAFNFFVERAAERSGKKKETVRNDILKNRVGSGITRVRSRTDKSGGIYYVALPVYERWRKLNWISENYYQRLEKTRKRQFSIEEEKKKD